MEQKKILVTYFDDYDFYQPNISKVVARKLEENLLRNGIEKNNIDLFMLRVRNFQVDSFDLEQKISSNNYDVVISMGLYPSFIAKMCKLERIKNRENNLFIDTKDFRVIEKGGFAFSFCYRIRNLISELSTNKKFKWEFIHIPQAQVRNADMIEHYINIIYQGMIVSNS